MPMLQMIGTAAVVLFSAASLAAELPVNTNSSIVPVAEGRLGAEPETPQSRLEFCRALRLQRDFPKAEKLARDLSVEASSAEIRRLGMLELAFIAQDAMEYGKAQQIYSEYARRYAKDPSLPEIYLRQGLLFREMGAHTQAEAKFYAVMGAALNLNLDRMEYYQGLVLKAQTEIAETYYAQGKYAEAAEYLGRLLKLDNKALDRERCLFKLIRCLGAQADHDRTVAQAQSFLALYPDSLEVPEVRFILAGAYKKLGRNAESMRQALALLESQQDRSRTHPELWSYWQQKTGNEIANQLYKEGDYLSALEIYLGLAMLNSSAAWQLPVWYQIGLVYEHLKQPAKAIEMYSQIMQRSEEVRINAGTPGMLALLDMAQWRRGFLGWQEKTDRAIRDLNPPPPPATAAGAAEAKERASLAGDKDPS